MSHKQIVGAVFGAGLALAAVPALAIDVDAFAQRVETAGVGGLTYLGRARPDGDAVVVDNVGIWFVDSTLLLEGRFTFAGIVMQSDGGYVVDSITAPEIVIHDRSTGAVAARLNDFSLTGYVVPGISGPDGMPHSTALRVGRFTWRELPMMVVEAASMTIKPTFTNEALTGITVSGDVEAITISLPDVPRESDAFARTLVALDVDELTFDLSDSMVWQDNGLLTYTTQTDLGEFGETRAKLVVSGVTQANLKDLAQAWLSLQTEVPLNARASAEWADPILGLGIEEASVRYEAGPLLARMLDYVGGALDGRRALATMVEQSVMTEIEALDILPVAEMVRPALRAFLGEPASLEARLDPPAPVTFTSLTAATMINKAGIVPMLGFTVTANEPPRPNAP
jgi:hypothetical protein